MTRSGSVLSVKWNMEGEGQSHGGDRGEITHFSKAARRRCLQAMASYDWHQLSRVVMVTLTLHPDDAPTDGQDAYKLLHAFRNRWERRYGAALGAWKREFTRQGTVHWHLWLDAPDHQSIQQIRAFCASAWHAIAAPHRSDHLLAGTSVEEAFAHPAKYAAGYCTSKGSKEYQHRVPEGFTNPGRWWGVWGMVKNEETVIVSERQAVQLRRVMTKFRRARVAQHAKRRGLPVRRPRAPQRTMGSWIVADFDAPDPLIAQLLRAAGISPT